MLASPARSGDAQIRDLDYAAMDIDDTGNVLFVVIPRYADDRNSAPPPENLLRDAGRYTTERNEQIENSSRGRCGHTKWPGRMHLADSENPPREPPSPAQPFSRSESAPGQVHISTGHPFPASKRPRLPLFPNWALALRTTVPVSARSYFPMVSAAG